MCIAKQIPTVQFYPSNTLSYFSSSRCFSSTCCSAALLVMIAGTTPPICCRLPFMLSMWLPICFESPTSSSSSRS